MGRSLTRRDFLKGVAAASVGLTSASLLGCNSTATETSAADALTTEALTTEAATTPSGIYIPGTYTAKSTGAVGEVIVTIEVDENSILSATVDASGETANIGGVAAEELANQILTVQGYEIDGVAGATMTAGAVRRACENCLAQAKGIDVGLLTNENEDGYTSDNDWVGTAPEISDDIISETISADVVVIGTGVAGVCATRAAVEEGASVIVLEKTETLVGRGGGFSAINGPVSKKIGFPEVDTDKLTDELMKGQCFRVKRPIVKRWADECGDIFDWFIHAKPDIYISDRFLGDIPDEHAALYVQPYHWPINEDWDPDSQIYPIFSGSFIIGPSFNGEAMCRINMDLACSKGNVDLHYSTFARKLIQDDTGRVIGVIAECDGKYIKCLAEKGVVMATGDYANNPRMLKAFAPATIENGNDPISMWTAVDAKGQKTNTGDGHRMGTWIGAQMQQFHAPMLHNMGGIVGVAPYLYLDKFGKRFMNENIPGQQIENQIDMLPGKYCWQIFDDKWREELPKMPESHGVPAHYFGDPSTYPKNNAIFFGNLAVSEEMFQQYLGAGMTIKGDTIEELVAQLDLDQEQALASIKRYNELCDKGVDEDFAKLGKYMFKIEKGPFYASRIVPTVMLVCCGGLSSDENCHIYNQDNEVIPGIYVAGNVQGDRFALEYPITVPGLSLSMAMTYGKIAGYNAVHNI